MRRDIWSVHVDTSHQLNQPIGSADNAHRAETRHAPWCHPIHPSWIRRPTQAIIGFTLSQRESYSPSGMKLPPQRDIVTQISPLHVGIAESVQSADTKHVVTTAVVATMVFPVKGIVEDIAAGASTGAVDMHVVSAVSVHAQDQRPSVSQ